MPRQSTLYQRRFEKQPITVIGSDTINALNNIPDSDVDDFMDNLKEHRLEYLGGLSTWDKYGDGWAARTERY